MSAPRHPYQLGGWMLAVFAFLAAVDVVVITPVFEASSADAEDGAGVQCPVHDVTDYERDILYDDSLSDEAKRWLLYREHMPCFGVANTAACLDAELRQYVALIEQGMSFDDAVSFVTAARLGDLAKPGVRVRRGKQSVEVLR